MQLSNNIVTNNLMYIAMAVVLYILFMQNQNKSENKENMYDDVYRKAMSGKRG